MRADTLIYGPDSKQSAQAASRYYGTRIFRNPEGLIFNNVKDADANFL